MRIAAMADSDIHGRATVAEHLLHSDDYISRQHEREQDRAGQIQQMYTPDVYVSGANSSKPLILNGGVTDDISVACNNQPDHTNDAMPQVQTNQTQANPTGTPNFEPSPPHIDASTSCSKTTAPCELTVEKLEELKSFVEKLPEKDLKLLNGSFVPAFKDVKCPVNELGSKVLKINTQAFYGLKRI
jgi:hypothetical protein